MGRDSRRSLSVQEVPEPFNEPSANSGVVTEVERDDEALGYPPRAPSETRIDKLLEILRSKGLKEFLAAILTSRESPADPLSAVERTKLLESVKFAQWMAMAVSELEDAPPESSGFSEAWIPIAATWRLAGNNAEAALSTRRFRNHFEYPHAERFAEAYILNRQWHNAVVVANNIPDPNLQASILFRVLREAPQYVPDHNLSRLKPKRNQLAHAYGELAILFAERGDIERYRDARRSSSSQISQGQASSAMKCVLPCAQQRSCPMDQNARRLTGS